jgi:hypothetical protein
MRATMMKKGNDFLRKSKGNMLILNLKINLRASVTEPTYIFNHADTTGPDFFFAHC